MGTLGTERPPERYTARYMRLFAERVRTAVNHMHENNFPRALNAGIISPKTVSLNHLFQGEFHLPLVLLSTAFTTTSGTNVNCSSFLLWSPTAWGTTSRVFFEVTGGGVSGGAHAVFEVHGTAGVVVSITTTASGVYDFYRSPAFTPPTTGQTLILRMRSTIAGQTAGLMGARLVILP